MEPGSLLPKLRHCGHIQAAGEGKGKPVGFVHLSVTPTASRDGVNDITALCVICAATMIRAMTEVERGEPR